MLILFSGLGGGTAQAQTLRDNRLDAQHIQRQQQQQQQFLQSRLPSAEVTPPVSDVPVADRTRYPAETPCFPISSVTLAGDSAGRFAWALDEILARGSATDQLPSPIGQCLGAQGIELLANHVQNRIMAAGYITSRVMVPPQNIGSGQLVLSLLPGRVQGIRFSDTSDIRAHRWNALPVSEGDLLNIRDLEQGLENFRRLPTVQADIQIAPASEPGQSDLIINWQQSRPIRLMATFDDAGSKSTGRYQGNLAFSLDHLFTLNDLFYVSHTRSLGSSAGGARLAKDSTLHYSIPFGYWFFSVNGSSFNYRQPVAGINESYVYSGRSRRLDLTLSRQAYRDARRKFSVYVKAWARQSRNFIDDAEIAVQHRRMAGWEAGFNHREYIGQATLDLNLSYRRGTGAGNARRAPEEQYDEGTSRPRIWRASVHASVPFAIGQQPIRYTGTWQAQWNKTPLIAQDQFSIGGRYTVRGFSGEYVLMADRGWFLRNELAFPLNRLGLAGHEFYAGVDAGHVSGQHASRLLGRSLVGSVIGLRGSLFSHVQYEFFLGKPISKPRGFKTPSATGGFSISFSI
ncbi:ShlB/FhaC/HecB family hemolysin secretion/activation protein [Advenella mimigardefordensis]|uniref:Putative hemolysin secretion/activation protein n=1 Tax=Advenella mimigardefordensis (strain DSM 17166 / LMG 22922 / DPN7) TaxID=1247726 RepID=W0PKR8_ADVMD|nr:ShlB/FhaC/HecB family hemolysin secretion/activation protein [Advenella mimigardefordensis]AHG65588.1 putative hemolysin secretion/activation protein [Advenella mimigardefordensis DPN7]